MNTQELIKIEPNIKITEFGALYAKASARISVDKTIEATKQACILNGVTIKEHTPVKELIIENQKVIWFCSKNRLAFKRLRNSRQHNPLRRRGYESISRLHNRGSQSF